MNSRTTPAATRICEASAKPWFVGCTAHAMRTLFAAIRDMQKPNVTTDGMNLYFLRRFSWNIVMWEAAPIMKRTRKTAQIGTSSVVVGRPPRTAVGPCCEDMI